MNYGRAQIAAMRGKHKYGAQKSQCLSGHYHASKLESLHCNRLLADVHEGSIYGYETQVSFPLTVNGRTVCRHVVDFLVTEKDGVTVRVEEVPVGIELNRISRYARIINYCYYWCRWRSASKWFKLRLLFYINTHK